ncbi:Dihydroxy-acid dehydratase [Methylobacterium frigidaeris]|uniref:Dihydroxy-acid dehydratase n=1 Tax=Methylobacterium frigidaeris TaxID=2038277 RepID=A0AA37HII8_9HYPH|nr:dihydroxy-acid dehydratase [Methylobacterium frigidaeris]GJD66434.1 Dihydroxy-acid dehydratase [Methylobacterium frigidaeris]
MSPDAAVGGGLALLRTGDRLRIDLNARRVDLLVDVAELDRQRAATASLVPQVQPPWDFTILVPPRAARAGTAAIRSKADDDI